MPWTGEVEARLRCGVVEAHVDFDAVRAAVVMNKSELSCVVDQAGEVVVATVVVRSARGRVDLTMRCM